MVTQFLGEQMKANHGAHIIKMLVRLLRLSVLTTIYYNAWMYEAGQQKEHPRSLLGSKMEEQINQIFTNKAGSARFKDATLVETLALAELQLCWEERLRGMTRGAWRRWRGVIYRLARERSLSLCLNANRSVHDEERQHRSLCEDINAEPLRLHSNSKKLQIYTAEVMSQALSEDWWRSSSLIS